MNTIKQMNKMRKMLKDRRRALLSMDREVIWAWMEKYDLVVNRDEDEETFWVGVHRARVAALDLPDEERQKSREWLAERGMEALG